MTTSSPEQIAEWREKFESKHTSEELFFQCGEYSDRYIQHEWQGYLRACTEQATEIAALNAALLKFIGEVAGHEEHVAQLKAQIAELMPFAKFGAEVLQDAIQHAYYDLSSVCVVAAKLDLLTDLGCIPPNIEATIIKILKD